MRLIDADVADKRMQQNNAFIDSAILKAVPTIDAVPVVRCRECVHYQKGSCNLHSVWPDEYSTGYDCRPDDDDFCSYGQRKEAAE